MRWRSWASGCTIAILLDACAEADESRGEESGDTSSTSSADGTTSGGSGESSWSEHSGGLTGEDAVLPCAWIGGTLDEPADPAELLSMALATCDVDSDDGPVARLRLANTDAASCDDPSAQPPCSTGYAAMWIDLAPGDQAVGTYDLEALDAWVDLQGGGTNEDDCGGYVGGAPAHGTLTITWVSPGSIEGRVHASMGDDLDFDGSFRAEPCEDDP